MNLHNYKMSPESINHTPDELKTAVSELSRIISRLRASLLILTMLSQDVAFLFALIDYRMLNFVIFREHYHLMRSPLKHLPQ